MISEIRDYFRQVITHVDSDLIEHDEPLSYDKIADTVLEDTYLIKIGNLTSNRVDTTIDGFFDVTIDFWKNGYNEEIENYDKAYCKAIDIQSLAMLQSRIDQTTSLKSVESNNITTEYSGSNDNLYRFTIQFTVRVGYYYKI